MAKKTLIGMVQPRAFKRGAPPRILPRAGRKPKSLEPKPSPLPQGEIAEAAPPGEREEAAPDAVAELEAVIGSEEEDEPVVEREAEEPSNFLAMYFRDMARLAVLRPQEEFESARRIEQLEIAVWAHILSHHPVLDHVLKVIERTLENSVAEFKVLRKPYKKTKAEQDKFEKQVVKIAEKLRAIDVDKRILDVILQELKKIFRGLPGRVIDDKLEVNVKAKPFRDYLRDVASSFNRAHGAKNEFVKANLRLVVSIARRFNYGRMPLADLIQEGNIGLIKAVERYDYRRGYRFSTYASWWIRHAISRALADKGRAVRLPVHMIDAYHRGQVQARAFGQAGPPADSRGAG